MSLWDDFKNSLAQNVSKLTANPVDITRFAMNVAQPVRDSVTNSLSGSVNPVTQEVGKVYGEANKRILEAPLTAYRYGVARPITTFLIATDPNRATVTGGRSLKDLWNTTEYISPGQEIVGRYAGWFDRIFGAKYDSANSQINDAIRRRDKLEHFRNNWAANVVSGASDFAFNFFLDPLVVGGKVAKAAKLARYTQTAAEEAKAIEAGLAAEKAGDATYAGTKGSGAWEFIKYVTATKDQGVVLNAIGGTNRDLAALLAATDNTEDAALIWLGSRGNINALEKLREKSASIASAVQANRSMLGFIDASGMNTVRIGPLKAELDDLLARDEYLRRAVEQAQNRTNVAVSSSRGLDKGVQIARDPTLAMRQLQSKEASFRAVMGYESSKAFQSTQYIQETYQRLPGLRKVNVWRLRESNTGRRVTNAYVKQNPSGIFHLQGSNAEDGLLELQAQLRGRSALARAVSADEASWWLNRYISAKNTEEASLILNDLEKFAIERLARNNGIEDEALVKNIVNEVTSNKNNVVETIKRQKGYWVDEKGEINLNKVFDTQTPNTFVMQNWDEIDRAMSHVAKGRTIGDRTLPETAEHIYDVFNNVWRPAVLFRLGYPVRNVSEGFLRFMAVSNAMIAGGGLTQGAKQFVKNRGNGWTARQFGKDVDQGARELLNELDGLIARRLEIRGVNPSDVAKGKKVNLSEFKPLNDIANEEDIRLMARADEIESVLATGKYRIGTGLENYRGVNYDATFAGVGGRYLRDLSSAQRSTSATLTVPGQRIGMEQTLGEGLGPGVKLPKNKRLSKDPVAVDPRDPQYPIAMANTVNQSFRNSPIAIRILSGEGTESIVKWLRSNDSQAIFARKEIGLGTGDELYEEVIKQQDIIDRYLPDLSLRFKAATRDILPDEVRQAMSDSGFRLIDSKTLKEANAILDDPRIATRLAAIDERLKFLYSRAEKGFKREAKEVRKLEDEYNTLYAKQQEAAIIASRPLRTVKQEAAAKELTRIQTRGEVGVVKKADNEFLVTTFVDGKRVQKTFDNEKAANKWLEKNRPVGASQPVPRAWSGTAPMAGPGTAYRDFTAPLNRVDDSRRLDEWVISTVKGADGKEYQIANRGDGYQRWQPIHGRVLEDVLQEKGFANAAKRFRDRVYNYIGTLPEDTLLRHPFVNFKYNAYMRQSIDDMMAQGVKDIPKSELDNISRSARAYALREVKRTLYTIDRYNNAANTMRFISPFFAAYQNTAATWGRIMLNDPSVAARVYQTLNAPVKAGWIVDQNGEPVEFKGGLPSKDWSIQVQIPKSIADKTPVIQDHPSFRVNLKSLNVLFQGESIFTPGFGPIVQVPVSEAIKISDNDATRFLADMTLTTGASTKTLSYDLIAPASFRRALSLFTGDNSQDFARDYAMLYQQRRFELEQSGQTVPDDLLKRVENETKRFYVLRFFANMTLPFSPSFQIKPEYQKYVDKYRLYQSQGTVDGLNPSERFRKDYPEFFAFGFSTTENRTGVTATRSARQNANRYDNLLSSVLSVPGVDPGVLGAIINNPNDTTYDEYTRTWQYGRKVTPGIDIEYRSGKSVKDATDQAYISQGWDKYIAISNETDAILKSRGLKSYSSAGAEDLQQFRRDWLAWAQRNNPIWFADYSNRDENKYNANAEAIGRALNDPTFSADKADDPAWVAIGKYLKVREQIKQELISRRNAGGSGSISSDKNSDLSEFYTDYVSWVRRQSPRADEIFVRLFDGEFGRVEDQPVVIGVPGGGQ